VNKDYHIILSLQSVLYCCVHYH